MILLGGFGIVSSTQWYRQQPRWKLSRSLALVSWHRGVEIKDVMKEKSNWYSFINNSNCKDNHILFGHNSVKWKHETWQTELSSGVVYIYKLFYWISFFHEIVNSFHYNTRAWQFPSHWLITFLKHFIVL